MKIGFIGLGNVGGKLAGSLFRNKFDLTVYDLDKNVTDKFKLKGIKIKNSISEIVKEVGSYYLFAFSKISKQSFKNHIKIFN